MLSDLNVNDSAPMHSSQDSIIENVIVGLIPEENNFNNPFQVADNIRGEMQLPWEAKNGS